MQDFKNQSTILEEEAKGRGHQCVYLPKFHCELNPIERCWHGAMLNDIPENM